MILSVVRRCLIVLFTHTVACGYGCEKWCVLVRYGGFREHLS